MRAKRELGGNLTSFFSFFKFAFDCVVATILMRDNLKERVNDTPTWVQRHAAVFTLGLRYPRATFQYLPSQDKGQ